MTLLWAVYYLAVFTIGRDDRYAKPIIWGGGGIVFLLNIYGLKKTPFIFYREGKILCLFAVWCLIGYGCAEYVGDYLTNLKLVIEMGVLVVCIPAAISCSGNINWFYWAFLLVPAFNTLQGGTVFQMESIQQNMDSNLDVRGAGMFINPNDLGFSCFLGLFGAMSLVGTCRNRWLLAVISLGSIVGLFGLIESASRGAFIITVAIIILWPIVSLGQISKSKLTRMLLICCLAMVVLFACIFVLPLIVDNTVLGRRLGQGVNLKDHSSEERLYLVRMAFKIWAEYPFTGAGLGQFPYVSGEYLYAHNEFAELLGTTGIVGAAIYYAAYITVWRRLSKSSMALKDKKLLYQLNQAKLLWIALIFSGLTIRPNFLINDAMFCFALIVGIAHLAERQASIEVERI